MKTQQWQDLLKMITGEKTATSTIGFTIERQWLPE
jgi:hypothetical protein